MIEIALVTSFIIGHTLQWLARIIERVDDGAIIRIALEWKPHEIRLRTRWIDVVKEDLKTLGV